MKQSVRFFATFVLALLLALASVGQRVAEARQCSTPSHQFRGPCISSRNCESACQTEGFPNGNCAGFRRRCMCQRPC